MKQIVFNYEFIFIFFICFILFLLISIFIKQKIIKKILFFLFSLFFMLFAFEFVLAFFMEQYDFVPNYIKFFNVSREYDIVHQREILLLNAKKNKFHRITMKIDDNNEENIEKKYIEKGYEKIYDTSFSAYLNGLGLLRYTKSNPIGAKTYVFLGCSFTFGSSLEDNETLPYYFSMLNKFESNVVNFSRCGKGTNYALNVLNSNLLYSFVGEDKQITKFFYSLINDHIYRNFEMLYSANGEGFNSGGSDPWILKNGHWYFTSEHPYKKMKLLFCKSFLFRKIFLKKIDDANIKYYRDYLMSSIKKMNEIVENKYKSKLTIIIWPRCNSDIIKGLRESNVDLICLPDYFDSKDLGYKLKDGHPTAKANEEIAQILYNHIKGKIN